MKILTFAVPCYNSEDYMRRCIDSLLIGGDDVEIIIVNDGSKDGTQKIAEEYLVKYPSIVRLINQENGGHGDAVNTGLQNAKGLYYKVVDSDDRVSKEPYMKILKLLKQMNEDQEDLDLLIANFVYDKQGVRRKKVMRYKSALPQNEIFTWDGDININRFQYILMHSVIFRTQILRDSGVVLPKHTFYVDNIFIFTPFTYVEKIYYLDVDFYRYYIGREDQSVNEKVMISRIDQQIRVNKILIDSYSETEIKYKKLDQYLTQYLDMMMCVSSIMLILSGEKENLDKKKELWKYLKSANPKLYKKLRVTPFGIWMNLPGPFGRFLSKMGYKTMHKVFGFN